MTSEVADAETSTYPEQAGFYAPRSAANIRDSAWNSRYRRGTQLVASSVYSNRDYVAPLLGLHHASDWWSLIINTGGVANRAFVSFSTALGTTNDNDSTNGNNNNNNNKENKYKAGSITVTSQFQPLSSPTEHEPTGSLKELGTAIFGSMHATSLDWEMRRKNWRTSIGVDYRPVPRVPWGSCVDVMYQVTPGLWIGGQGVLFEMPRRQLDLNCSATLSWQPRDAKTGLKSLWKLGFKASQAGVIDFSLHYDCSRLLKGTSLSEVRRKERSRALRNQLVTPGKIAVAADSAPASDAQPESATEPQEDLDVRLSGGLFATHSFANRAARVSLAMRLDTDYFYVSGVTNLVLGPPATEARAGAGLVGLLWVQKVTQDLQLGVTYERTFQIPGWNPTAYDQENGRFGFRMLYNI